MDKMIQQDLEKRILVLDGAMGTQLNNRGFKTELPLWTADANITHPDLVKSIHSEYIYAGADIITTNTFRSTSWTYKRAGYTDTESKMRAKKRGRQNKKDRATRQWPCPLTWPSTVPLRL